MKQERLSEFEWTLLWMAIRYAMNRQTIASACLPSEIVKNYYKRLTKQQKEMIVKDLRNNEEEMKRHNLSAFGNHDIDRKHWVRFIGCLDEDNHYVIELLNGVAEKVFDADDKIIPFHSYIERPYEEIYIPQENVKKILNQINA